MESNDERGIMDFSQFGPKPIDRELFIRTMKLFNIRSGQQLGRYSEIYSLNMIGQ